MSQPFEPIRAVDGPSVATTSAFLPVLILALALLAWFGFQATQLRNERDALREASAASEKQMDESKKLRAALDALARGTQQLADGGNQNARLIVEELKKRGITISTTAPPTTPATPDAAAPKKP